MGWQTGCKKFLYREMRELSGDEKTRLTKVLATSVPLKEGGDIGEKATAIAEARLAEIAEAEKEGPTQRCDSLRGACS